jgi:hypothetical protein
MIFLVEIAQIEKKTNPRLQQRKQSASTQVRLQSVATAQIRLLETRLSTMLKRYQM